MKYYIPGEVGGKPAYLDTTTGQIYFEDELEVDPFSRVSNPGLRPGWDEGLRLSEEDRKSFENARYAYTRAVVR